MHMHLQITMSGGLFVMTSMFVTRDDATTTHMLYTFWRREFLNCCVHVDLKQHLIMVAKNFLSTLFRHWFHWLMDPQWSSMKRISKCIPKQRAKVQGKTKGLAKGTKEGTKEVKERKKGRRVSTTTRIILRTQCSILMKT